MFNSTIVDVVIGLIFVYLLLAIICSSINEWVARLLNLRATNLNAAINQLLDKQPGNDDATENWFLQKFYAHPLIAGMHDQRNPADKAHPSYMPSRAFATAVMDIVTPGQAGAITFDDLQQGIQNLPQGDVRKALLAVIQSANRDLHKAQKNIETWYDDTMERVGGWYKSKMQIWTVVIAAMLTIAANADTVRMTHLLWLNPTQRAEMVESAKARATKTDGQSTQTDKNELNQLDSLIGWGGENNNPSAMEDCVVFWAKRLLGWFLTIIAVSLGAPFWFDLLNKIVNLRDSGNKPKTAEETAAATPAPAAAVVTPAAPQPPHPPAAPAPAT